MVSFTPFLALALLTMTAISSLADVPRGTRIQVEENRNGRLRIRRAEE